ncbi:hypothetical protein PVAP13_6NG161206 [Panicum virgatum]|uniref:Uncharacterized protein n=1 Tax=Panicum virgatum TaxID=38727 RepID=A0A8T0QY74_PANVG|nr:hypothetical protein PVAP13_6NG161206 [Panicum virgatum]
MHQPPGGSDARRKSDAGTKTRAARHRSPALPRHWSPALEAQNWPKPAHIHLGIKRETQFTETPVLRRRPHLPHSSRPDHQELVLSKLCFSRANPRSAQISVRRSQAWARASSSRHGDVGPALAPQEGASWLRAPPPRCSRLSCGQDVLATCFFSPRANCGSEEPSICSL